MRLEDWDIGDLIPQSGRSVLLDKVLDVTEESIRCLASVRLGDLYVGPNGVGSIVCLEWMAQAIATYVGVEKKIMGRGITKGYLLSCRELCLDITWLDIGDEFVVSATVVRNGGSNLGSFACDVFRGKDKVASGTLNVYQGELQ